MKHGFLIILLILAGLAYAQEAVTFQPPQPHDVQRYEAGWNKNPFTLKTAPPVVESVSFARDLAIGTYYGDSANPTIIIVNTKTNERTSLKQDQPAANGMKLSSVKFGSGRKDVVVEVTLGAETAAVRYNDSYVKQMAAAEMTKTPATQQQTRQQPGSPQKMPPPQTSPQQLRSAPPGPPPAAARTASVPSLPPVFVVPADTLNPANQPAAAGVPSEVPPPVPASPPAGMNSPPQIPLRQRLITPARNATAPQQ